MTNIIYYIKCSIILTLLYNAEVLVNKDIKLETIQTINSGDDDREMTEFTPINKLSKHILYNIKSNSLIQIIVKISQKCDIVLILYNYIIKMRLKNQNDNFLKMYLIHI